MSEVVLGVSGGIAAYKAVEVLRQLTESGHAVTVVPTASALRFVGEPTWAALSGRPVASDVWTAAHEVPHVRLGRAADLVLVVPATADLLARAVAGRADDLLTSTLLTATCPQVFAPAMHTEMWEHPATRANVATLRERGALVIEPASGRLTGADSGPGRLPDPLEIAAIARSVLDRSITATTAVRAGVTWPVATSWSPPAAPASRSTRCASSATGPPGGRVTRSPGPRRFAAPRVTLVSANVELPDIAGASLVRVRTAAELRGGRRCGAAHGCDAVVMTAAVADFRPLQQSGHQDQEGRRAPIPSRSSSPAMLTCSPASSEARSASGGGRGARVIVGFAAETDDVLRHGREKLRARAVTCWWSTRWARAADSRSTTTPRSCWPPTAAEVDDC